MKRIHKLGHLFLYFLLAGCGSPDASAADVWIVSGQSNALRCDWGYVESKTGYEIYNIAKPGTAIQQHIDEFYYPELEGMNVVGVIFVNGGADAKIETPPDVYIARLKTYRRLIHSAIGEKVPFVISNIGYNTNYPDRHFNKIREAINEKYGWIVAFNGAQYFRELGMLVDETHYSAEGCKLMMDSIINIGIPVAESRYTK